MSSGIELYNRGALSFQRGNANEAFEFYRKSIKKILKDENVTAKFPGALPNEYPQEILGIVWSGFTSCFRDATLNFTEESHPEAYKLLSSFRASAPKPHARLERTPRGIILLKGMQIVAGLTLGLLAWDKRDRATASKRYQEAIDVAATHPPFVSPAPGVIGLERWVHIQLEQIKDNLDMLIQNDTLNAEVLGAQTRSGDVPGRRDVVDLPVPQARIEGTGAVTAENTTEFATTACAKCGKRAPQLRRCSVCMNTSYCSKDCQAKDWKVHKKTSCMRTST